MIPFGLRGAMKKYGKPSTSYSSLTEKSAVKWALDLLNKNKWLDADEILSNNNCKEDAGVLLAIIRLHLSQDDETIQEGKNNLVVSLIRKIFSRILLEVMISDAEVSGKPSINCIGYSLISLLHPDVEKYIFAQDIILALVHKHISSLNSNTSTSTLSQVKEAREKEWNEKTSRWQSQALKSILKLIGLTNIKNLLFSIGDRIELDKKRGLNPKEQPFNVRFDGNSGTVKTTVARIYAKFLKERGILKQDNFEETSGSKLVNGGTSELTKNTKKVGIWRCCIH